MVLLTHGDPDQLDRSLDALLRQDLTADYDILIVEDDPDPASARMAAAWSLRNAGTRGRQRTRLRYLPNEGTTHGAGAVRNLGWQAASAPIVAFTGDHTVVALDWLRQGLTAMGDGALSSTAAPEAVFGSVESPLPRRPTELQRHTLARQTAQFAGCNWFCRRSILERLGGFDERFDDDHATDTDLYFRLLEAGVRMQPAPAAKVAHPLPAGTWWSSVAQLRALSSEALLYKKHPRLYREKIRRPPDWHDLAVVATLLLAVGGLWQGHELLAVVAGGAWLVLTAMLSIRRLRETAGTPSQVTAVLLTSPLVPPLALFWRLAGALRHRVRYA